MRVQSLTLAAAGAALLAPATLPTPAASYAAPGDRHRITATELLARVRECTQVSRGRYRSDADTAATVPVCGTRQAVFWKADLDIDCDGQRTSHCNRRADPAFTATTAYQQSNGRQLNAEKLPYVVVPGPSGRWNHWAAGIRGGAIAAVIYKDRVQYAVVGDTGPRDIIGEASYATAKALGVNPDPRVGGVPSGVTYIVFKDSGVRPIEDRAAAEAEGERLAEQFAEDD
ncbi:MAG: glycoside hydrolase family 75 protein [Streptomyces sp.]|uniref:glycoside hydrolase family 75 protein n=1 Tax=Streptomyces sp. TaxID=1931 RepID=UPI0025FC8906|nr:glycoside hydrolase family 75 protein [Streptomyces sp.]MBW8794464.1 glycoside hydrolase family 75 protein [Streptomyces sp.]